ncbi:DUF3489 domain-containing protein [Methylobacterium brachythecii]|uniref:DUF3489 domain-containing protein n=1 Tax=Methylobacterium brachythecii TaxID=1176177 RepID=A0A7W6AJE5_9HYPH|nr:DUF3489 domain-containing protein [Methylobacterium brachythecii]MBB3902724.1 hypothetical protein [Methylobacterium brachythecii]GLS42568.1 hypothetical protein GCM10007884_05530 [Methylobacterium brachythecii]
MGEKLIGLGFAETIADDEAPWWSDPALGPTGLRLIIDASENAGANGSTGEVDDAASAQPVEPHAWTKIARVLALLRRFDGADIAALVAATDWLPHTARAALTGLRRRGHAIETCKEDGRTVYRVASAGMPPSDREMAGSPAPRSN